MSTAWSPAVPGRRSLRRVLGATTLATLLAALDQTILATALPRIVADLDGFRSLAWVVTAYLLASTVTIPLYGKLGDIYGRRRMLVVAIGLFLLGSALCGAAASMGQLVAFRVIQGLGAGGLVPLSQAAIGDVVAPRERGRYQAYIGSAWAIAAVAGPLVGGTVVDHVSWRWLFLVNLPLGAVALGLILRALPASPRRATAPLDLAGAALLVPAASLLMLAAASGSARPAALAGAGGAVLLAGFVAVERRAADPLLGLDLLGLPAFRTAAAASAVIGAVLFAVTVYVPVFLQGVLGLSATASGVVLVPLLGGWVGATVVCGRIIARTGRYRRMPVLGASLLLAGTLLLTRCGPQTTLGLVAVAVALVGAGLGMQFQTYMLTTQSEARPGRLGVATAGLMLARSAGATLGTAALGALFAARAGAELSHAAAAGAVGPVFWTCAGLAVLALALSLRVRQRPLLGAAAGEAVGE